MRLPRLHYKWQGNCQYKKNTSVIYSNLSFKCKVTLYFPQEVRFCKSIRVYASALYMMQMILYTAVAVYAPALALSDGNYPLLQHFKLHMPQNLYSTS